MKQTMTYQQHNMDAINIFGFWIYILSDCILFATIFATYAVLYTNIYGGISIKDLTNLPYIFVETIVLLMSSFTCGLAILASYKNNTKQLLIGLLITFLLGLIFVSMEIIEFINFYLEGHSWQKSAALSAFFTLVGTHGFHVLMGLLWIVVMILQLLKFGLTSFMKKRLAYFGLFWAFLDIVWIFVFTIVYLMGSI